MTGRLILMSMSSRMAGEWVEGSDRLAGWTGDWDATMLAGANGGMNGESW
jgi:hypothetical protein